MKIIEETYVIGNKSIIVRREDLIPFSPLPPNGKMPALEELIKEVSKTYPIIGCFATRVSNWSLGVSIIAQRYGMKSVICYPEDATEPSFLTEARKYDAEVIGLKPNYLSINVSQAKKLVESKNGFFIPFGLEHKIIIDTLMERMNFQDGIPNLVLSCGSGITLLSVLLHLKKYNKTIGRIYAVSSGRKKSSIIKTLSRHMKELPMNFEIIEEYKYNDVPEIETKWPTHQAFERKAYAWMIRNIDKLENPIRFLNIGSM